MLAPVPSSTTHRIHAARKYRGIIQRWFWLLALCTLIGGSAAFVVSKLMHPTYQATALLVVGGQQNAGSDPYTNVLASTQLIPTYLNLITQPVVLQRAAAEVGGISAQQLASQVSVKNEAGTQIIELDVDDASAERAARLANAIASTFTNMQQQAAATALTQQQEQVDHELAQAAAQVTTLTTQVNALSADDPSSPHLVVLQQQLAVATAHRDALKAVSAQLTTQQATASNSVSVFQPATPPPAPDHPKPLQNAAIGAALGLIIATVLVWLLVYFDDRIRTPARVEELLGLPLLGTLGSYPRPALPLGPSPTRRLDTDLHVLAAKLEQACSTSDPPRTLAVTSAASGDGRTTTAVNLAITLARQGKRVLLVDGDLRQSSHGDSHEEKRLGPTHTRHIHLDINELLDCPAELPHPFGLSTILTRQDQPSTPLPTLRGVPRLFVLPAGPRLADPPALFRSHRMHQLLQLLARDPAKTRFDAVIFDTPPADAYPDAALLVRWVDATILVVDAAQSGAEPVQRAKGMLVRADARIAGVVLNRAPAKVRNDFVNDFVDIQGPAAAELSADSHGLDVDVVSAEANGTVFDSLALPPLPPEDSQNGHASRPSPPDTQYTAPHERRQESTG